MLQEWSVSPVDGPNRYTVVTDYGGEVNNNSALVYVDWFDSDDRQFDTSRDMTAMTLGVDVRHDCEGGVTKKDSRTGKWAAGGCQLQITTQNLRLVWYKYVNSGRVWYRN